MVRMYARCSKTCSDALEVGVKDNTLMSDLVSAKLVQGVFKFCDCCRPCGARLHLPPFLQCALFRATFKTHLENLDDEEVSYSHFVHFVQYRLE